jgi:AcrR family transcriptional regulator
VSPRPYNLGKRAASVEQTKQRIRHAALREYAVTGVAAASMQSIARRADVAPGTVLYHYPDPDDLVRDVMANRVEAMAVPTADTMDADAPLSARITWLTRELFRVYEGTELDYQAWMRSRDHPQFRRYERWYYEVYGAVLAAALGPDHTDPRALQVVSALIDPGFRASLAQRGLTHDDAVEETVRLVLGWLTHREPAPAGAR